MRRDLRQLAALIAVGLVLGVGHLALRPDLPWVHASSPEEALCAPPEPEAAASSAAPAASFAPAAPMSSPGPEDVP